MGSVPSCGSKTAQINEGGTPVLSPKPEPNQNITKTVKECLRMYVGAATHNADSYKI